MKFDAIIFDFDGVILDSVGIKTFAFGELVRVHGAEAVAKMQAYHEAKGGISRFVKFEWFYREVLGREISASESQVLGERFRQLAFSGVMAAPFITGAEYCLEHHANLCPLFVASGTPQSELDQILTGRSLNRFFKEAFGSPRTKSQIISDILTRYGFVPEQVVFVGDAISDYRAARETGLQFIGIAGESSVFPPGTTTLRDLTKLNDAISAKS